MRLEPAINAVERKDTGKCWNGQDLCKTCLNDSPLSILSYTGINMVKHVYTYLAACFIVAFPLVSRAASCPDIASQILSGTATTITGANVRNLGCVSGKIVTVLSAHATVTLTGSAGSWDQVKTAGGKTGWVASWLLKVNVGSQKLEVGSQVSDVVAPPSVPSPTSIFQLPASSISSSLFQFGKIPSNINLITLNQYWLSKINALRQVKGLRLLVLDQRLVDTASKWSGTMAARGVASHTRDNGETPSQWAIDQGLQFTKRYSVGGWVTNFFTENIEWGITNNSLAEAERALDQTLVSYLAEGPTGAHYQTVYFPDWNSVGAGFAFVPNGSYYDFYQTFHYASLAAK